MPISPVMPPLRTPVNAGGPPNTEWAKWFQSLQTKQGSAVTFLSGTHAGRLTTSAGTYTVGSIYYESDRNLYYISGNGSWAYLVGVARTTQANLYADLGTHDAGLLVEVTDYHHCLRWSGSAWEWAPGESGSGYVQTFLAAPTGNGWHLCDGASVSRLNANGTLTTVTLPDYTTAAYLKLGKTASVGPNAASGTSTAVSAGTPAGTVSQPTFTGSSAATSTPSSTEEVQAGSGTTVAKSDHTHSVTATGTVSQPTFTGSALGTHAHGPNNLELRNTQLLAYYRQ